MVESRPNVLFVLTDQERYDCTEPGASPPETPTFDRLSEEGMRFERAYTPISICTSARASLLTGQFPHGHGMLNNCHEEDAIRANLPPDIPTFSEALSESGYDLTYTGKWHVGRDGVPEDVGFRYLGGSDTHHDDIDEAFRQYRAEMGLPLGDVEFDEAIYTAGDDGTLVAAKTPVPVEATRAYFLAERTIDALERHALERAGAPFFHRVDFYGPHHPYVVPEPYASMYDPDEITPWDTYAETFAGKPQVHEEYLSYRGVSAFDWDVWAAAVAKYWGFETLIDHQVARVLEALDELDLTSETVVVHASDHGDFTGSHRQFNKGPLMYEETYHVPLQVRWPDIVEPGSTCDELVHLHDLAPTFLELGDVPIPETFHARSFFPLLEGDSPQEWPDSVFAQYHGDEFGLYSQRMVRTERFKFVFNGPDVNELYDLEADPAELQNLIDHPHYVEVRDDLQRKLIEWMQETADPNRRWVPKALD